MPEIAIDEDSDLPFRECDIGAATGDAIVRLKMEPFFPQELLDDFLNLRPLAADLSHHFAPLLLREDISHQASMPVSAIPCQAAPRFLLRARCP